MERSWRYNSGFKQAEGEFREQLGCREFGLTLEKHENGKRCLARSNG